MATRQKIKKLCPSNTFFFAPTTRAAKEEASSEGKRLIDLMDGEELIDKYIINKSTHIFV
jgi:hypothetical protein